MHKEGVLMGCCNERGVLRPLLSGSSAASRNGNSASRYQNNGDSSARYNRNKKRSGRKTGNKSANDISQRHITNSEQDDYDDFDDDDDDINVGYSTAASYWCCIFSEMLRKIGLLVWKNLLFRKRHWVVTALEIILPTLCAMILASMKTQAGGGSHIDFDVTGNQTTIFPGIKEDDLKLLLALKVSCTNCIVAYAPDTDQTKQVIQELASNLEGTKIDWQPFADEGEIEKLLASLSFNNTASGSLRAAIVFENGLEARSSSVSYKIRMVDDFHDTGYSFRGFSYQDLMEVLMNNLSFTEHVKHYAESGFSGFQVLIDKILAKRFTGQPITHSISLQAFPYPPYTISFDFNMLYFILLPQLFVLGFIFMVPSIIRSVVSEKETGIRTFCSYLIFIAGTAKA
ncbi:ATP-binding cassette sub-family A member 3 [Orchesella cincta]|uniref:ATP-binding cassette sub-family A member 3 n=1 Tax=Orchesella cincta TaxID=48709 RepID=A0A1D2MWI3_ORCCI|nr:ATP-binding cassette sub-family A member 3 [Orchesella cincta]